MGVDSDLDLVNNYKEVGNECYKRECYDQAIDWYTKAININGENPSLYNNRSAAFLMLNKYTEAYSDAHRYGL